MMDKLLTVEETAERLGTSVRFVRRLVFERRIAYVKLGRYRAPDGTERNNTFRRKADAEKFLATVESAKVRGAWTDPAAGRATLAAWLEEWWGSAADPASFDRGPG